MKKKVIFAVLAIVLLLVAGAGIAFLYATQISNPWNVETVGNIPAPRGYARVEAPAESETIFLRGLPLKPHGSKVKLFTGGNARLQCLSAAVVDLPMLSNAEQCADMTMRLRAEWLFKQGRYADIRFQDVNGNTLQYKGGDSRKAFEKFLRRAYGVCSTYSVYHETKPRQINDVKPGDIFVYPAKMKGALGHAIIVVDVARKDNKIALLLAEGNTPARDCHILLNPNLLHNPWFFFDGNETAYQLSFFHFKQDELRHY